MIVIENIKWIETDRDILEIVSTKMPYETVRVDSDEGPKIRDVAFLREYVRGRRFCRPDGKEINVGMSKQAQEVIGIQYEAWEMAEKERDAWISGYFALNKKLNEFNKAGFWKLIRYWMHGILSD